MKKEKKIRDVWLQGSLLISNVLLCVTQYLVFQWHFSLDLVIGRAVAIPILCRLFPSLRCYKTNNCASPGDEQCFVEEHSYREVREQAIKSNLLRKKKAKDPLPEVSKISFFESFHTILSLFISRQPSSFWNVFLLSFGFFLTGKDKHLWY